jgi:hypothetical protein
MSILHRVASMRAVTRERHAATTAAIIMGIVPPSDIDQSHDSKTNLMVGINPGRSQMIFTQ